MHTTHGAREIVSHMFGNEGLNRVGGSSSCRGTERPCTPPALRVDLVRPLRGDAHVFRNPSVRCGATSWAWRQCPLPSALIPSATRRPAAQSPGLYVGWAPRRLSPIDVPGEINRPFARPGLGEPPRHALDAVSAAGNFKLGPRAPPARLLNRAGIPANLPNVPPA